MIQKQVSGAQLFRLEVTAATTEKVISGVETIYMNLVYSENVKSLFESGFQDKQNNYETSMNIGTALFALGKLPLIYPQVQSVYLYNASSGTALSSAGHLSSVDEFYDGLFLKGIGDTEVTKIYPARKIKMEKT